jgi:signal transduction histidine kinase
VAVRPAFDGADVASRPGMSRVGASFLRGIARPWHGSSLASQFLFAGGLVALLAMLLVSLLVTSLIERAVTRSAAATTALYVDSIIAPLLPDMQKNAVLDDVVRRALDETLGQGALGSRLVAMRLWAPDGRILYAKDDLLIGRHFELTPDLKRAFTGEMVANYGHYDTLDKNDALPGGPLLEIYNPILQPWSGNVVAVLEFYERADDLQSALAGARLKSWFAVAAVTALFFLLLSVIVLRGSHTIDRQAGDLTARVSELTGLLEQNRALHARVRRASQRVTSLNESYLRRLGADLHDGPAQLIALASLRLDSEALLADGRPRDARESEVEQIRTSLGEALQEIRTLCHGLVLPHIETADFRDVVSRAIDAYEQRTGSKVERSMDTADIPVPLSQRICVYRFLQEALNNGYRHCREAHQSVVIECRGTKLHISVSDDGHGFDPDTVKAGSIGIAGMRERIESLGGQFDLYTSPAGTKLAMTLDIEENHEW